MSARKDGNGDSFRQHITVKARQTSLELSADSVIIHKSGIEFHSPVPFNPWTEMIVGLFSPHDNSRLQCAGVVIACPGNKHTGYYVSVVFTSLTKQSQARLNSMARSELGL